MREAALYSHQTAGTINDMMKSASSTLLLLTLCFFGNDVASSESCGEGQCCVPVPESCCPTPTTTTTKAVTPPRPTTVPTPIDLCSCKADVVFLLDRTGSVEVHTQQNMLTAVNQVLDIMNNNDFTCFRTAGLAFAVKTATLYNFQQASTAVAAKEFLSKIKTPRGDTNTGRGLANARLLFKNRGIPKHDDACKVLVLLTDGGSEDKPVTYEQAEKLRDQTSARVCLVEILDRGKEGGQLINRDEEMNAIIDRSAATSELIPGQDFFNGVPSDIAQKIYDCICKDCSGQPRQP